MSRRNKFGIDMSQYTDADKLAQGLNSAIEQGIASDQVKSIPIDQIMDMPGNDFLFPYDDSVIDRIAEEIKANGFHSPIIVVNIDNKYTCISGHQRKRAMKKLGFDEIPCIVLKDLSERAARDLWRAENSLHREPTPLSRARLVESYCKDYEKYGMSGGKRKYAAGKAGISEGQTTYLMNILSFPDEIQQMCLNPKFPYVALSAANDFTDEQKDLLVTALQNYMQPYGTIPSNSDLKMMIERIRQDTAESEYEDAQKLDKYEPSANMDLREVERQREREFKSYYKKNFISDPQKTTVIDKDLQNATDSIYALLNGGFFITGNDLDIERSLYGLEKAVSMLKRNLKRKQ